MVFTFATSEPPDGSVTPRQKEVVPSKRPGSQRAFWADVPAARRGGTPITEAPPRETPTPPSMREHSSFRRRVCRGSKASGESVRCREARSSSFIGEEEEEEGKDCAKLGGVRVAGVVSATEGSDASDAAANEEGRSGGRIGMEVGRYVEGISVEARPVQSQAARAEGGAVPSASHSRW